MRWIVLDTMGETLHYFFETCYSEAMTVCENRPDESLGIAELLQLLRVVNPAPKRPYQCGGAVPVGVTKIVEPLTHIRKYVVESESRATQSKSFPAFPEASQCFELMAKKYKSVQLSGHWINHSLYATNSILYESINGKIIKLTDPCKRLSYDLTFFTWQHYDLQKVAYFDSSLKKASILTKGKILDRSLFVNVICEQLKTEELAVMKAVSICFKPFLKPEEEMIYCNLAHTQLAKKLGEFGVFKNRVGIIEGMNWMLFWRVIWGISRNAPES